MAIACNVTSFDIGSDDRRTVQWGYCCFKSLTQGEGEEKSKEQMIISVS